jgi:hypothetical protein
MLRRSACACAVRAARTEAAIRALRPFVDIAWWRVARVLVDFHDSRRETDAAIALVRGALDKGSPHGIERLAALLAKRGRVDKAVALLRPHAREHLVLDALMELTEGHGYDGEVTALVRKHTEADSPLRSWKAGLVLAGQMDEALEVLTWSAVDGHSVFVNADKQLADIVARHGREQQLRELVAGDGASTPSSAWPWTRPSRRCDPSRRTARRTLPPPWWSS